MKVGGKHPILSGHPSMKGESPMRWAKSTAGAGKAGRKEINHDPEQRERSREDYGVNVVLCLM